MNYGTVTDDPNALCFAAKRIELEPTTTRVGVLLTRCHFNIRISGYDPEQIINQVIADYGVDKVLEIIKNG